MKEMKPPDRFSPLDIGVFGARDIPSTYSGYETFLTELLPALASRGHKVTMYTRRSSGSTAGSVYRGVHRRPLPEFPGKNGSTLSHGAVASARASVGGHDVLLVVNVANALFTWLPRLLGTSVVLNTDGQEWLRGKWGRNARKIFLREITNWKELGGADSPINLYSRQDNITAKRTVEQVLLDGESVHESAKVLSSSQTMIEQVSLDPFAIGFISHQGYLRAKGPALKISPLSIDGIDMDERNIGLALYPLIRQLFLVIRDDSSEISKKFINFVLSNEGQTLLAESGALRVR